MEEKNIIMEKIYDAPAEKVWKALTDKEEMKKWYFEMEEFNPVPGFEFSFMGQGHKGEQYKHLCRITEAEPNKKLVHTWAYENYPGSTEITFELNDLGDGKTSLSFKHTGLETFPQDNPDFAHSSFRDGWDYILNNALPEYLEKHK